VKKINIVLLVFKCCRGEHLLSLNKFNTAHMVLWTEKIYVGLLNYKNILSQLHLGKNSEYIIKKTGISTVT
jgi:hypothetical protein